MDNIAILVGNTEYEHQRPLPCCSNDLAAMKELLEAAGKFSTIETVSNADADELKSLIRGVIKGGSKYDEILFYFMGHGVQTKSDFYFCSTEFDSDRRNETGLSHKELLELVRAGSPDVLVLITDACNSGTLVVKGEGGFLPTPKDDLRDYIQIASCLDSQVSLAGDPLSEFTERFCQAAIRKKDGSVFYSDIINTLRDDYIENGHQTPFFVQQGTMREFLAQDATSLASFKEIFETKWLPVPLESSGEPEDEDNVIDMLQRAGKRFVTADQVPKTIDAVSQAVRDALTDLHLEEMYDIKEVYSNDFYEELTRTQMIGVLSK